MAECEKGVRVLFTGISGTGVQASLDEKLIPHLQDRHGRQVRHFRVEAAMVDLARKEGRL